MRWTAGVLYLVLCIYQMLAGYTILIGAGISNATFVWIAAVLIIPISGCMAIWMLGGDSVFSAGLRRGVVVGTAWFVIFELITYSEQTKLINYTFSTMPALQGLYNNQYALYGFMIFRLLLMILAAFFVTSCRDSMDYKREKKDMKDEVAAVAADKGAASPAAASADLDKPLAVAKKEEEDKPKD